MVKYWNERRVRRIREKRQEREERAHRKARDASRAYRPAGDIAIDGPRMLDALGFPLRRAMVARLQRGGAMSLSKLIEPFNLTLAAGLKHLHLLERAGIVVTHKRGRIRFCVYNSSSLKSLATHLTSRYLT